MTTLKYYGHSCFLLSADNGWKGVFDPYEDGSVDGLKLPEITADAVFCSHGHSDHNAEHLITIHEPKTPCPYETVILKTDHDNAGGLLRGKNDIVILKNETETIIHCGDLGRRLRDEEAEAMKGADLLMIPSGGFFTIDIKEARAIIDQLQPRLTVLMHFRRGTSGYKVLASLEKIAKTMPELHILETDTIDLKQETGIVVLTPSESLI